MSFQNGLSKQNETHFNLRVYTDPTIIKKIHEATKMYTMFSDDNVDEVFNDRDGKYNYKEEYSVTNSQIYANAVFIWCDDEDNLRGGTHILNAPLYLNKHCLNKNHFQYIISQ